MKKPTKKQKTNKATPHFTKGNTLLKSGEYAKAINEFDKAIELDPKYAKAYCGKGLALFHSRKNSKAIEAFTKAIEFYYTPETTYYWDIFKGVGKGGIKMLDSDLWNQIKPLFSKAVELAPNTSSEQFSNASKLIRWHGKVAESIEQFHIGISKLKCTDAKSYMFKGVALSKINKIEEAIIQYDKAIELDPDDIGIYFEKALALVKLGKVAEANALCKKIVGPIPETHHYLRPNKASLGYTVSLYKLIDIINKT